MSAMLYEVLAGSGGFVNGTEVAIGAEVPLTEPEARYELAIGAVAPTGRAPVLPVIPVLLSSDLVGTRRDARDRAVPVASLEMFLFRQGGLVQAAIQALGEEIRAALLGGAPAGSDTLAKLAAALAAAAEASVRRDSNLSDLTDEVEARLNLGLGEVATMSRSEIIAAVIEAISAKEF